MMQKKVVIPLGILVLLAVVILLVILIGLPWAKDKALEIVSEKLGREVVAEGGIHPAWAWPPALRIEDLRIANASWSGEPWMAKLKALEVSVDALALIDGRIVVPKLSLIDPWILLQRNDKDDANWQFDALKSEPSQEEGPAQLPIFKDIEITGAEVLYRTPDQQLTTVISKSQGRLTEKETHLEAKGKIAESPFSMNINAGGTAVLEAENEPFPIDASLDFDTLQAALKGNIAISGDPTNTQAKLQLSGQGEPPLIAAFTNSAPPDLPDYQLDAQIDQTGLKQWSLDSLNGDFGDSRLQSTGLLDLSGERPYIKLDTQVAQLDIAGLQELAPQQDDSTGETPETSKTSETPSDGSSSDSKSADTSTGLDLTALAGFDADISIDVEAFHGLDAPVENALLNLSLKDGRLQIDPLSSQIAANELALTADLNVKDVPVTGQVSVKADQVDLAQTAKALALEASPPGTLWLDATLDITGQPIAENDLFLPSLGQIRLAPSQLRLEAPSLATRIDATLQSAEGSRLKIDAQGSYRDTPFELDFLGDSPLALRDPERPYSLEATVNAADTRLFAQGKITKPLTQQTLDLRFEIEGPNPERLARLLEFPLPDLPPYSLAGQLYRKGNEIKVTDFAGKVGDSDLNGNVELNLAGSVPRIDAKLTSDYLDFDDLGTLIGAPPDTGAGETVSAQQQQEAAAKEASDHLFPQEPLNINAATGAMQASIEYRAKRVETDTLPLDELYFQVNIGNDLLEITPLEFNLGEGDVHLELSFDTSKIPTAGSLEGEVRRIDLKRVLAPFDIADDSVGEVGGRMRFWMRGDSIADFLASADGGLLLVMTGGQLDNLLVELAGIDIAESLAALFGNKKSYPIDCAYLDLPVKNGIANIETAVIDTSDTLFLMDGSMYFASETLDIVIEPRPKDTSLLSLRSPVYIDGKMQDPSFTPGGSLVGRGLAVVALAAAAPIAGLIPLIDPGDGEDSAYCKGLTEAIDRARK